MCGGWSDLNNATDQVKRANEHVLFIQEAPHEWLLPKCSMVLPKLTLCPATVLLVSPNEEAEVVKIR